MTLTKACLLKENYGKIKYADYIMENINNARLFFEFPYFWGYRELGSEIMEINDEDIKSVFKNDDIRPYFDLFFFLGDIMLHVSKEDFLDKKIKIIKNKERIDEIEAIFVFSIRIYNGYFDYRYGSAADISISEIFFSKNFFIEIAKNLMNYYKINNKNEEAEALNKLILFLNASHSDFFLVFFNFDGKYILDLSVHYSINPPAPSIKFTFKPRETRVNDVGYTLLDRLDIVKKSNYLELKLKDFIEVTNIRNIQNIKDLVSNIFMLLLPYCFGKELIRNTFMYLLSYFLDKDDPHKKDIFINFQYSYNYSSIKRRAKKFPLLYGLLGLFDRMNSMSSMRRIYRYEFSGDFAFIEMQFKRHSDDNIELNIDCLISKGRNKQLLINILLEMYSGSIFYISLSFEKQFFDKYFQEKNIRDFINDLGKFLIRLKIFSHLNEFLFLAKYARGIQILSE